VDLSLNRLIPAALAQTVTTVKASTKGGDKIFCMEVFTAPTTEFGANEENLLPLPEQDVQITGSNNSMNGHDNCVKWPYDCGGIPPKAICCPGFVCEYGKLGLACYPAKGPPHPRAPGPALDTAGVNVNANSVDNGDNTNIMNGHDNGVNVNVNVLGIQEKKNVEKSANLNIDGDQNSMNGHDNGVNVNVNVLGIQAIKNLASGSAQMDGNVNVSGIASIVNGTMSLDAESGLTEIAEIIKETVLV
jgi:hypothetical protein